MPILTEEERVGTLLAGRYQLDAIMGRGGTGVVFEATHGWTGRKVAVKLLRPEYARDVQLTRRFLQEARAAAGLSHPNVVQVLDMGNENDGTVHLVLERLEGESLGKLLEDEGRLAPAATLKILVPIMDALILAHRQGIIHRDLKPDNIYLHEDGAGRTTPKLLDFGMAKVVDAAWGTATSTGTLVGTPFYMSPEQAEGRKDQGPASDVWSMGVVLYRCLTGALPFYAETPTKLLIEIVRARSKPVAERAPELPSELAAVVDRCLLDDQSERWKSMKALVEALRSAAEGAGIPFPDLPDAGAMEKPAAFDPGPRREASPNRRKKLFAGAALIAALIVFGAWWSMEGEGSGDGPEPSLGPEASASTRASGTAPAAHAAEANADEGPETPLGREVSAPTAPAPSAQTETETETETGMETRTAHPRMTRPRGMMSASAIANMGATGTEMGRLSMDATTMDMRLPGVAEDW